MKLVLLSVILVVAWAHPFQKSDTESEWEIFKFEHQKDYPSQEEEKLRKQIFLENLKFVDDHNKKYERGEVTFNVAINKFSDLAAKEFGETYNGLRIPVGYNRTEVEFIEPENLELPKTVDWRKKGAVTPVKNQGACGSCWAFSATGSLEGQNFLKTKKLVSLSEQNLVDCSRPEGNQGCEGGLPDPAFIYVKKNNGIDTEESYPYQGTDQKCRYKKSGKGGEDTGYVDIKSGSENQLQQAIATKGPISVGIDANHPSFQHYKSGVYKEPKCSTTQLDHGVLAVGYGHAKKGGDYYIVKNSWGTGWGMQGYFWLARNDHNMCGVATLASYPTV